MPDDNQDGQTEGQNTRQLREAYERLQERVEGLEETTSQYEARLKRYMFREQGIPVGDDPIADLVAEKYDGDLTEEAVAEFAQPYVERFQSTSAQGDEGPSAEDQMDQASGDLDQLEEGGGGEPPEKSGEERIAEGDVEGGFLQMLQGQ